MTDPLEHIVAEFETGDRFTSACPLGSGLIHKTFAVTTTGPVRYVLQQINTDVLANIAQVQQNIRRVTDHLRGKIAAAGGDLRREVLTLVPTRNGEDFLRAADGRCWRMSVLIEGARTHDRPTPEAARAAAEAFGRFQQRLTDLPVDEIHRTIPDFHNTPARFAALVTAVEADVVNRAARATEEINVVMQREGFVDVIDTLVSDQTIPTRITHNDTKLNNVLIDEATARGLCVIDLDTVMGGASVIDFGDCCRTTTATTTEDDPDPTNMRADLVMFEQVAAGYLGVARTFLTTDEIDHLVPAVRLIALEQGMRFLTDWLSGDVYYPCERLDQNLDRARTQFALMREFESAEDTMRETIDRYR